MLPLGRRQSVGADHEVLGNIPKPASPYVTPQQETLLQAIAFRVDYDTGMRVPSSLYIT